MEKKGFDPFRFSKKFSGTDQYGRLLLVALYYVPNNKQRNYYQSIQYPGISKLNIFSTRFPIQFQFLSGLSGL
jgi:hypothetical protein